MYKLGLYLDAISMKNKHPSKVEKGDDLNMLLLSAGGYVRSTGYYQAIILNDQDEMVARIDSNLNRYMYFNKEECQKLGGLLYQLCNKMHLRRDSWYKLSGYSGYDREIYIEEHIAVGDRRDRIYSEAVKALVETFIVNVRELTGFGVASIIFNAKEVKESNLMYIGYREEIDNCVRVECRKRF